MVADLRAVTATSPKREIAEALRLWNGQKLVSANVDARNGATRLDFDLGAALTIRRDSPRQLDEVWKLYRPSGYVLVVRSDGMVSHERGTRTERWRPL
jgi:hypothetical protein